MTNNVIKFKHKPTRREGMKKPSLPYLPPRDDREISFEITDDAFESEGLKKGERMVFEEVYSFNDGDFVCVAVGNDGGKAYFGKAFALSHSVLINNGDYSKPIPRKEILYIGKLISPKL